MHKTEASLMCTGCTLAGHVDAEVDPVDGVHIDRAWLHKHGRVTLGAFPSG